jgi:hypothetical protein
MESLVPEFRRQKRRIRFLRPTGLQAPDLMGWVKYGRTPAEAAGYADERDRLRAARRSVAYDVKVVALSG